MSSWIEHVRQYAKENNVSYSVALKEAKQSYKEGGALGSRDLKKILGSTYEEKNKDIGNFKVDKSLSGKRAKVYHNDETGQTVVAHRGTQGIRDWVTDARMVMGDESSNRFKHAKKVQKQAEAKYGTENLTTVGHSLAGRLAEKYGKKSNEIITLNKAVVPDTIFDKLPNNQYDIRSSKDVVSGLAPLQRNKRNVTTIEAKTINPLIEHKTTILNRLPDKVFGKQEKPKEQQSQEEITGSGGGTSRPAANNYMVPSKQARQPHISNNPNFTNMLHRDFSSYIFNNMNDGNVRNTLININNKIRNNMPISAEEQMIYNDEYENFLRNHADEQDPRFVSNYNGETMNRTIYEYDPNDLQGGSLRKKKQMFIPQPKNGILARKTGKGLSRKKSKLQIALENMKNS